MCGDNRFEVIRKAKEALLEETNIKSSPWEMEVIDSILYRYWQMGWLKKYEPVDEETLDRLAEEYWEANKYEGEDEWTCDAKEAFRAGYLKAMGE